MTQLAKPGTHARKPLSGSRPAEVGDCKIFSPTPLVTALMRRAALFDSISHPPPAHPPFPPAGGRGEARCAEPSLRGPLCPVASAPGQSFPLRPRNTRSGQSFGLRPRNTRTRWGESFPLGQRITRHTSTGDLTQ
jgi:hypothetical protein